jgi:hypothetical protein
LYQNLLRENGFGQAHCEEWFIQNLFYKFWTLLQVSMNFGNLKQFLLFKTIRKTIKSPAQYWAETGPRLQPMGRGGLPRAVG